MVRMVYCAKCRERNNLADNVYEAKCAKCEITIRDIDYSIVSVDVFDFMTLGTDFRMPPRADNG